MLVIFEHIHNYINIYVQKNLHINTDNNNNSINRYNGT